MVLLRACSSRSGREAFLMQRPGIGKPTIAVGVRFQPKRLDHYGGANEPELTDDCQKASYTAGELTEYVNLEGGDTEGPGSGEVSRKRPMDHVDGHALNAQQNVYRILRRGLMALSICTVTTVCGESRFLKNLVKAHGAQDDKSSSNVDLMLHIHGEPLDSKPDSPLNGLFSIFDTTEKTKSGKLLPKGYLKSARQVVKSLKESLKDEFSKEVDVRRSANSAKESIRDYLQNWKGQKVVESEDSYKALEDALKALGKFYIKQGPRALLPSDVKSQILMKLEIADAAL